MNKVLIVEDEMIIARSYQLFLSEHGYQVGKIITKGKEVTQEVNLFEPDVILMDILIKKNENGIVIAKELRKEISTPIIFLTGNSYNETLNSIKDIESTSILTKPVDLEDLLIIIEQVIKVG